MRKAFVLVGPTASGKSAVGHLLAERMGAAVLSADAMLVYRGMDIGTAKPSVAERGQVPYLGVDLVAPDEPFDLWQYRRHVRTQLDDVPAEQPLLVIGGSGLYVRALLEGLDPVPGADPALRAYAEGIYQEQGVAGLQAILQERAPSVLAALADPCNPRRLIRALEQISGGQGLAIQRAWLQGGGHPPVAGLWPDRAVLHDRIASRVRQMYADGLLAEAAALQRAYPQLSDTAGQAIGYREALEVLAGERTVADAQARTIVRTRRLAKRQGTWFRHQARVAWLYPDASYAIEKLAAQVAEVWRQHGSVQLKFT